MTGHFRPPFPCDLGKCRKSLTVIKIITWNGWIQVNFFFHQCSFRWDHNKSKIRGLRCRSLPGSISQIHWPSKYFLPNKLNPNKYELVLLVHHRGNCGFCFAWANENAVCPPYLVWYDAIGWTQGEENSDNGVMISPWRCTTKALMQRPRCGPAGVSWRSQRTKSYATRTRGQNPRLKEIHG